MQKKVLLLLFGLIAQICSAQKDVTVPETTSFDTGIGSQSSVNQSNGKLGISLNLISLKGYKDLTASFGIGYDGNNITRNAKASNENIPTGVLGLGWGMSFSRILADNKLTASREDDTFYAFEGGSLVELRIVEKQVNPLRYEFMLKQFKPWKIYFYPNSEEWIIVKENGYKYTYANVDWAAHWGNWIGNSNQANAQRQGSSWNLTSVEDLYGNKVEYEYVNVEQSLINTGNVKHTEATYLSKITGPCGEEIRLIYDDKLNIEYYEPNTNHQEPDAYQENYETKYLKWVEAYDTDQNLMYKYRLDYDYLITGNGEFRKRILEEITLLNGNNESQLFRKFEYDTNPNSDFYGNLLHQILPTQGRISYQYEINEINYNQVTEGLGGSEIDHIVYGNYIIEIGNQKKIHTWNGSSWEQQSISFGTNEMQIVYQDNFFAVLWRESSSRFRSISYGLKDDGYTWQRLFPEPQIHHTGNRPTLVAGEDFYGIGYRRKDIVHIFRWNGYTWSADHQLSGTSGRYFYGAANNYIIQNTRGSNDVVKFYYYDIENEIKTSQFSLGVATNGSVCSTDPNSPSCPDNFWYCQNSLAQVNANSSDEILLTWDENFNFQNKTFPFRVLDDDPVYGLQNNSFLTIDREGAGNRAKISRYLGNGNWDLQSENIYQSSDINHSMGIKNDMFFQYTFSSSKFKLFNANNSSWIDSSYQFQNGGIEAYDFFGKNYAFSYSKIVKINSDLSISTLGHTFPNNTFFAKSDGQNSLYLSSLILGGQWYTNDFAKLLSFNTRNELQQYNFPFGFSIGYNERNGIPKYAIGGGTIVVQNSDDALKIYKIVNGEITANSNSTGVYKDIVVVKETYDPVLTRKQRNYYCYSNPRLSKDNSRVFYSQVSHQNDLEGVLGKTVSFYDAGLGDIRRTGLPIKKQVFDADNNLVSEQKNTWQYIGVGSGSYYFNLLKKSTRTIEKDKEIIISQFYTYDSQTGLLKKTRTEDSEGNNEITTNYYLYQEYPSIRDDHNLLTPVIYMRSYSDTNAGRVYKSASAVRWNVTANPPYPKQSYQWDGTGGPSSSTYNFTGSNPNFRLSQNLSKYDSYGNLLEERNLSQVTTAYLYGYDNKRLVAKIEGASHSQAQSFVNMGILNNPFSDSQLRGELDKIRIGLPNAYVTTYTYKPSVGITSITDPRGRTLSYFYESFYRLDYTKNNEGHIINKEEYHYREAPFTYSNESTDLPDCELINQTINNDPNNAEPLTLTLEYLGSPSNETVTFKVTASDGGNYSVIWDDPVWTNTDPSVIDDFLISANNNTFFIGNSYCRDGTVTIRARIVGYNPVSQEDEEIESNALSHTFSSIDCVPR